MPTARPIITIIIVTKKTSWLYCPITATAASATRNRDHRQAERQHRGDDGPEQHEQHDERDRDAEPLAPLQVVPRQLVVLVRYARVAPDEHQEVAGRVRLLDPLDHLDDVRGRLLGRARHGVMDESGALVLGGEQPQQPLHLLGVGRRGEKLLRLLRVGQYLLRELGLAGRRRCRLDLLKLLRREGRRDAEGLQRLGPLHGLLSVVVVVQRPVPAEPAGDDSGPSASMLACTDSTLARKASSSTVSVSDCTITISADFSGPRSLSVRNVFAALRLVPARQPQVGRRRAGEKLEYERARDGEQHGPDADRSPRSPRADARQVFGHSTTSPGRDWLPEQPAPLK